ncbi:hypothetical protein ACQ4PT_029096 [Festuca glaucescens]
MASLRVPKRRRRDLGPNSATDGTNTPPISASPSADVVFEILSWLPVKPLCRCRCVSKTWRAVISNPAFVAAHRSRAEPLLATMTYTFKLSRALQLRDTEGNIVRVERLWGQDGSVWACLDNLVCISSGYYPFITHVFDLAIEKTLLYRGIEPPEEGTWIFGFGRTAQSGVYKVLRLGFMTDPLRHACEVLYVRDGQGAYWRRTQSPPARVCYACSSGITVSGALHFLSHYEEDVLCFDLESEEWKVIQGPPRVASDEENISIAELNDSVCMVLTMPRLTINYMALG